MTGSDSFTLNNRVIADFADQDALKVTFPNEIANVKTGKNGNSIYGLNESGKQCEIEARIIRGSSDDKYFNNLLTQQQANFAAFPLMIGEFVKKIGYGNGVIGNDTYILSGGIFTKQVEAKMNTEGDTEQSISIYKMKFSYAPRAIT